MVVGMADSYETELFQMPVLFKWTTYVATVLIVSVFVVIAQAFVYRHIRKLDWAEGVKIKE